MGKGAKPQDRTKEKAFPRDLVELEKITFVFQALVVAAAIFPLTLSGCSRSTPHQTVVKHTSPNMRLSRFEPLSAQNGNLPPLQVGPTQHAPNAATSADKLVDTTWEEPGRNAIFNISKNNVAVSIKTNGKYFIQYVRYGSYLFADDGTIAVSAIGGRPNMPYDRWCVPEGAPLGMAAG